MKYEKPDYNNIWTEVINYFWGSAEKDLFFIFKKSVESLFNRGDLSGNITKMINKFKENKGGIFESEQLSENLAQNIATKDYCDKINIYISHILNLSGGDIYKLFDPKIYYFKDKKRRNTMKKDFGDIMFTWNTPRNYKEGFLNLVEGRTIALNDIWAKEIYLENFKWIDEYKYKATYRIILWDHFGLDLPDIQKVFNILPIAWEIFACWFLLQHRYNYRPFITKVTFCKEFEGDIRVNLLAEKEKLDDEKEEKQSRAIIEQNKRQQEEYEKEKATIKAILQRINKWDIHW